MLIPFEIGYKTVRYGGDMKKLIIALGVIAVVCIIGGGAYVYIGSQPRKISDPLPMPESGKITIENAAPLFYDSLPADYFVVDVRTPEEYEKQHTANVVNIPVALFEEDGACEKVISQLPENKKIIFVCPFGPVQRKCSLTSLTRKRTALADSILTECIILLLK